MREPTIPYLDGPDLSKPVKATVTTRFNEAEIEQRLSVPGAPNYTTHILKLQESGVREALVRLGWTPPEADTAFLRGVKAGLEAAQNAVPYASASYFAIRGIDPATIKESSDG